MTLLDFIRLLLKHKTILMVIPIFLGLLAVLLTMNPRHDYYSQTVLYTGIASGSSIEMEKSSDYFASNIAFDNLINIINSRDTQEEVAVRLLAQHLLLKEPKDKFISNESFEEFSELVPTELKEYGLKLYSQSQSNSQSNTRSLIIPEGVSNDMYEETVKQLLQLMKADSNNFIYSLLNYEHRFYSLDAISKVKAVRISSSDLVKISYEAEDPGICQQTLAIFVEVCIRKYKDLKENGSDEVVKYFEAQLRESELKLKTIEDELLAYNQDNDIINYYEQSKAVANVREDMEVAYKTKKAELAGSQASKIKLEKKLSMQSLVQEKSDEILVKKELLGNLNYRIVMSEAKSNGSEESKKELADLKSQANQLQKEISKSVTELYSFQNSTEGVPVSRMLPQYIDRLVEAEDLAAEVELMNEQSKEFQKEVKKYAPAGANIKRIEREINVIEEEYLELLRGLNLAKLKFQDTQLSDNLKTVDPPYFPLNPIPSKRKLIIIAVVLLSFILLLGGILFMDFFDETLKSSSNTEDKVGVPSLGIMPKIFRSKGLININRIQERLMDFTMHNIDVALQNGDDSKKVKVITLISTRAKEGKTTVAGNIAKQLKSSGESVMILSPSFDYTDRVQQAKFSWMHRFFGYQDPRNDYAQPFLSHISKYLDKSEFSSYKIDSNYQTASSYKDLLDKNSKEQSKTPNNIIVELPNILDVSYPTELIENSDLVILVCRSNRLWSKADQNVLSQLKEVSGSNKVQFFINGVELKEVESVLGELPRQRSKSRKKIKKLIQFQFNSKSTI